MSQTANIQQRFADLNQETLVFKALRKCEPGNKRGNISKCWKLDHPTLHEAAMMHIVGHKSAREIREELQDRFAEANVSERVLSTWLKAIRKAYGEEHTKFLAEVEANESIAFMSGDLVAVLAVVMASIAPKFVAFGKTLEVESLENQDGHLMMRFMNTMIDAAKVQAEARRTEAQTQNILIKLREAVKVVGGQDDRDPGDVLRDLTSLLHMATGVKVEAQS
jgi:predicted phage gp36 major capsid-like protein